VDIPGKRLDLLIDPQEWSRRLNAFHPRRAVTSSSFLESYAARVGPASQGAVTERARSTP